MTKPVAVFRSGVIEDSRHTVRLDENSHLVLFPERKSQIHSNGPIQRTKSTPPVVREMGL
jgi:hypothetical protein